MDDPRLATLTGVAVLHVAGNRAIQAHRLLQGLSEHDLTRMAQWCATLAQIAYTVHLERSEDRG
jgi:hypothetical protein